MRARSQGAGAVSDRLTLGGTRVLDFSWGGAGPLLTRTLGDFGADVVKVESDILHDFPRTLPPFAGGVPGVNRSEYFTNRNSSKRSIVVDLRHNDGQQTAYRLALVADVVVNNFRGGVLDALGLGNRIDGTVWSGAVAASDGWFVLTVRDVCAAELVEGLVGVEGDLPTRINRWARGSTRVAGVPTVAALAAWLIPEENPRSWHNRGSTDERASACREPAVDQRRGALECRRASARPGSSISHLP